MRRSPVGRSPGLVLVVMGCLFGSTGWAEDQAWTELGGGRDLAIWASPTRGWQVVGEAVMSLKNPRRLEVKPGLGILANGPSGKAANLVTRELFGDLEVSLEFLVPKGSNSGVKFQGLYEVQISDSFGIKQPSASDCGGIYPRAELKPKYHHIDQGFPPRMNAARPPGEWQSLAAIFRAPRFDRQGKKVANARFVKVTLNGQVVQAGLDVPTPTGHAWTSVESPTGPLFLQGDHGPVAYRNIRIRKPPVE